MSFHPKLNHPITSAKAADDLSPEKKVAASKLDAKLVFCTFFFTSTATMFHVSLFDATEWRKKLLNRQKR